MKLCFSTSRVVYLTNFEFLKIPVVESDSEARKVELVILSFNIVCADYL